MTKETGSHKQTAETARKAKKIRKLRETNPPVKWEEICRAFGILKENGEPDTGLAHRIAYDEYEPKKQETRDRLGLKKICLSCGRGFRRAVSGMASLSPWRVWWRRLPPQERDRRIREDWEKERE